MKIYTLVGKSGTGKSFQAMNLAKRLDVESIIDDGLFIYKNVVIEGKSAKKSATKVGAIKAAIFFDDKERDKVAKAIAARKPKSVLILGTSDEMTNKIIDRLGIKADGEIKRVYIEDITNEEERNIAHLEREKYGKHVIPAPSLQLKRNFAGYLVEPLRIFRGRDMGAAAERTVVRPPYSYLGDYIIEERVIDDIIECSGMMHSGIAKVTKISQTTDPENYKLFIGIKIKSGFPVWETAQEFQRAVNDMVEGMTAFNVTEVDVEVRGVI